MPSRKVTCGHCQKEKVIMVQKQGHITADNLKAFEADGWQFKGGRNGTCSDCVMPGFDSTRNVTIPAC